MSLLAFVDAAIARVTRSPPSTAYFAKDVAVGDLFDGAAGVAFFLHEAARLRSPAVLPLAAAWADCAEAWARSATKDEWEPIGYPTRWGLMQGLGGVAYVRVLVSSACGDDGGVARGVEMLLEACVGVKLQETRATFLFEGAAGLLCAVGQLRARVEPHHQARLTEAGDAMWQFLAERLETPLGQREGTALLGLAHGIAGELWAAIDWVGEAPVPGVVRARLAELLALAEQDDRLMLFPKRSGEPIDDYVHTLCNGMTGQAVLWTRLADRGEHADLRVAGLVASALDLLGPAGDYSLCCGLAGQAAVHATVAASSKGTVHARRGLARIGRAAVLARPDLEGERALQLWRGPLGVATVALLRLAREPHVPCLELPRRR